MYALYCKLHHIFNYIQYTEPYYNPFIYQSCTSFNEKCLALIFFSVDNPQENETECH